MAIVTDISEHRNISGSSGPPADTDARLRKVEEALGDVRVDIATVKQRLDSELPQVVTKAELKSTEATLIKWMVGVALAIGGLAFAAARFMK
jgi:hypothetical protein